MLFQRIFKLLKRTMFSLWASIFFEFTCPKSRFTWTFSSIDFIFSKQCFANLVSVPNYLKLKIIRKQALFWKLKLYLVFVFLQFVWKEHSSWQTSVKETASRFHFWWKKNILMSCVYRKFCTRYNRFTFCGFWCNAHVTWSKRKRVSVSFVHFSWWKPKLEIQRQAINWNGNL